MEAPPLKGDTPARERSQEAQEGVAAMPRALALPR